MENRLPTAEEQYIKAEDKEELVNAMIEFAKLHAIEIIKKLSKTENEFQYNINYIYPLKNIK